MHLINLYLNKIIISNNIWFCDNFSSRARGLIGRPPPCDYLRDGFLFPQCSSIHMFFMRYPIDVLFFNGEGMLLEIRKSLQPWRIAYCAGASNVLEVAANATWINSFREGDYFSWGESTGLTP